METFKGNIWNRFNLSFLFLVIVGGYFIYWLISIAGIVFFIKTAFLLIICELLLSLENTFPYFSMEMNKTTTEGSLKKA
jgi:hypothetical protein